MKKVILVFGCISILSFSCKKENPTDPSVTFDKQALLTNVADQIILPNIQSFAVKTNQLFDAFSTFELSLSNADFEILQAAHSEAYLAWQKLNPFDFGPIRDNGLKAAMNTYPTDTAKILSNVQAGNANLGSAANLSAIGFPALDFIFFRKNSRTFFSQADFRDYARNLISKIKNDAATISNGWNSYRSTFISKDGTESTSSFSLLVNEFNRDFELTKNAKVGIPMGKQSLGFALPDYFESRYKEFSKELFVVNMRTLRELFEGKNGIGFDNYLNHLEKGELTEKILSKFDAILNTANSINSSFPAATNDEPQKMEDLYLLLSQQVVNIKTDMTSSFGVLITYQDNDGD
ncbi:MAG: imelysin family protein [Bacteroidetes bacterium]|nr:imelysin family protein [Bacteroidota bacterium]